MNSKPPATASVAEVSTTVSTWSNSRSETMLETSIGVACRKHAAAAPLDPVDEVLVVLLHEEAQALGEFLRCGGTAG